MMNSSEWVLKIILNRFPAPSRASLERFLPKEERNRLESMPLAEVDTDLEEPSLLDRIHWSWILPLFKDLNAKEQKLYLSVLPPFFREPLCRELKTRTTPDFDGSKAVQEYLLQTIVENLAGEPLELLPVYFLPPTPLLPLLKLSKQQLVLLIDDLALIDLAAELRQIVETKILKKIYSFLSEEEKKALKKAASANQPPPSPRLHLEKWDGIEESLRVTLHKRGLARLGAALSLQHPDFTWYVCHQLDIGRGTTLAKLSSSEIPKSAALPAAHRIEEWLKDLK